MFLAFGAGAPASEEQRVVTIRWRSGSLRSEKLHSGVLRRLKEGLAQAGMPASAQEELSQNMQLLSDFGYYGGAPEMVKESRSE